MKKVVLLIVFLAMFAGFAGPVFSQEKPAILVLGSLYNDKGHLFLIDPMLEEKLKEEGYRVASTYYEDLTYDIIKKFNIVIMVQEPIYDPEEPEGYNTYLKKLPIVKQYLENGGGLMVFFDEIHYTPEWDYSINKFLQPLDMKLEREDIADRNPDNFHEFTLIGHQGAFKTNNILESPVTNGVKEWYYPRITGVMHPGNEWQIVIKGPESAYTAQTYQHAPPLLAIRDYGKGRIVAFPEHSSFYVFNGFHRAYEYGFMFNEGDGYKLFENLFSWLAQPSESIAELGRYKEGDLPPHELKSGHKIDKYSMLEDAQAIKGVVGIYTTYSGGLYTIKEFAAKARELGLDYIAITDRIITREKWDKLVADCEAATDDILVVMPGVEFAAQWGGGANPAMAAAAVPVGAGGSNLGFAYNIDKWPPSPHTSFIAAELTTGEKYGGIIAVANPKSNSAPPWNHGGFHALEIASFSGMEQVAGALDWFEWFAGIPAVGWLPIASHRVWNMDQLEEVAQNGYLNYLYAPSVSRVRYAPVEGMTPGFVSDGPVINEFKTANIMRDTWEHYYVWQPGDICTVDISVSGNDPLTDVILMSGKEVVRHFRPMDTSFEATVHVPMAQEGSFHLSAKDVNNRTAYSYTIPTRNLNYWNHIGSDAMNDYHNPILPDKYGGIIYDGKRYGFGGLVTLGYGWGNYIRFYHPVPSEAFHPQGYETGQIPAGLGNTRAYPKLWASNTDELDKALTKRDSLVAGRDIALLNEKVDFVNDSGVSRESEFINTDTDITIYRYIYRPFGYIIMPVDTKTVVKKQVNLVKRDGLEVGLLALQYKTSQSMNEYTYISPDGEVVTEPIDLTKPGTLKILKISKGGYFTMSPDPFGQVGLFITDGDYEIEIQGGGAPTVWIGHDLDGEQLKPGREFEGHFIVMEEGGGQGPEIIAKLWDLWGLDGTCNYAPEVKGGTIEKTIYTVNLAAEDNAIMAKFPKTELLPNHILPIQLDGVNGNWTCAAIQGDWYYPGAAYDGTLYIGIEDPNEEWYFLGNPLVADNADVKIGILELDSKHITFTVHNPTSDVITTTVSTNPQLQETSVKQAFTLQPGGEEQFEMTF